MEPEFVLLAAVLVLGLVHIFAAAHFRTRQYGLDWNMGARDEAMPPLGPVAGRLQRAQANFFETLPLFLGALLACALVDKLDRLTLAGAHLYFWSRLVYLPLYAAGIPKVRSVVWGLSLLGILLLIWALLT